MSRVLNSIILKWYQYSTTSNDPVDRFEFKVIQLL